MNGLNECADVLSFCVSNVRTAVKTVPRRPTLHACVYVSCRCVFAADLAYPEAGRWDPGVPFGSVYAEGDHAAGPSTSGMNGGHHGQQYNQLVPFHMNNMAHVMEMAGPVASEAAFAQVDHTCARSQSLGN